MHKKVYPDYMIGGQSSPVLSAQHQFLVNWWWRIPSYSNPWFLINWWAENHLPPWWGIVMCFQQLGLKAAKRAGKVAGLDKKVMSQLQKNCSFVSLVKQVGPGCHGQLATHWVNDQGNSVMTYPNYSTTCYDPFGYFNLQLLTLVTDHWPENEKKKKKSK